MVDALKVAVTMGMMMVLTIVDLHMDKEFKRKLLVIIMEACRPHASNSTPFERTVTSILTDTLIAMGSSDIGEDLLHTMDNPNLSRCILHSIIV